MASFEVFLLLMQTGTTSTSPRTLKSSDFPYITGSPAFGPISPNPKMAVPSVIIVLNCLEELLTLFDWTNLRIFCSVKYFLMASKFLMLS